MSLGSDRSNQVRLHVVAPAPKPPAPAFGFRWCMRWVGDAFGLLTGATLLAWLVVKLSR